MKKIAYFILALLMLLTLCIGCAKKVEEAAAPTAAPVVETPEPTEEVFEPEPTKKPLILEEVKPVQPEQPVNPDAAVKNTDEQIDEVMKPYYKWAKMTEYPGAASLRYACSYVRMPELKEWKKVKSEKSNMKYLFFEVPYNIGVTDLGNQSSQFMTNKELIEQIGEKQVRYYGDKGSSFADTCGSNYPKDMTVEKMVPKFKECGLPDAVAQQLAQERVDFYDLHKFTREALIAYDDLLVYRAADGLIRCRVEYNTIIRDADDNFCVAAGMKLEDLKQWFKTPMDIAIYTDEAGVITDMKLIPLGDAKPETKSGAKQLEALLKG